MSKYFRDELDRKVDEEYKKDKEKYESEERYERETARRKYLDSYTDEIWNY